MERRYAPEVEAAGTDITARAQALSAALSRDGFVASTASIEAKAPLPAALSSVQLCQGHCPIQQLATQFPVFCDAETEMFSRLVGVDVRRLSTLARGGHVCTTHIPTGRPAISVAEAAGSQPDNLNEVSNHLQERP
jgi:predicted ArsR family transcriptional regulator